MQPRVWSNPDTNQGPYFYYITTFYRITLSSDIIDSVDFIRHVSDKTLASGRLSPSAPWYIKSVPACLKILHLMGKAAMAYECLTVFNRWFGYSLLDTYVFMFTLHVNKDR